MSEPKEEVIEAVLVDDDGHPVDENLFERVTRQGAETLDAFATVAENVAPEAAGTLRKHANTVRSGSRAVVSAADTGRKFVGSVGEALEKLGLRDRLVMVRRAHGRNGAPAEGTEPVEENRS